MSKRFFVLAFSALAFLFQSGCQLHVLPPSKDPSLYLKGAEPPPSGVIGVIPAQFLPEADFPEPPGSLNADRAKGAAMGSLAGLLGGVALCINPLGAATCSALPFIAGGAAVGVGAAEEKHSTASSVTPKEARDALDAAFRRLQIQKHFEARIVQYAKANNVSLVTLPQPGPKSVDDVLTTDIWRDESVNTVLETAVLQVGMRPIREGSPKSQLTVIARVRVFRRSDRQITHESKYRFVSPPLTVPQWAENDAEAFRQEFSRGLDDLAEQISDRLFLVYDPPGWRADRQEHWVYSCVYVPLRPQYPVPEVQNRDMMLDGRGTCTRCGSAWTQDDVRDPFSPVDSLQPTLSWQPFPSVTDREADPQKELERVRDVEYELRIFQAVLAETYERINSYMWMSGDLVVGRTVKGPNYRVEKPLKACTRYLWTYRARFTLGNHSRATEWAGGYQLFPAQECQPGIFPQLPSRLYYPFMTPCTEGSSEANAADR